MGGRRLFVTRIRSAPIAIRPRQAVSATFVEWAAQTGVMTLTTAFQAS